MARILSPELLKRIEAHILEARKQKNVMNIYRTAEAIQLENPSANVALEDIMEQIIRNSGSNFAVEFAPEWGTRNVPLNEQRQEFLLTVGEAYIN